MARFPSPLVLALPVVAAGALALPAAASAASTVTITSTGVGKAPKVSGTPTAGYTTFRFKSGAKKEVDYTLVHLKPGETPKQAFAAAKGINSPTKLLKKIGPAVTGGSATPHAPAEEYTVKLSKGTYVLADSTRAPTLAHVFKVKAAGSDTAPKAAATITLDDYMVMPPATLPAGGEYKIVNKGPSPHFIVAIKAKNVADATKIAGILKNGKESAAQKLAIGFSELLSLISPGQTNYTPGLQKGEYVLACFYADAKSKGKEHSKLGMEHVVSVR